MLTVFIYRIFKINVIKARTTSPLQTAPSLYRVFPNPSSPIKRFALRMQETLHRLVRLSGLSPVPCVSRAASFMATGPQCINLQIDFYFAAALRSHPCTRPCQTGQTMKSRSRRLRLRLRSQLEAGRAARAERAQRVRFFD